MVERVLFGNRASQSGFYVSRPGVSVLTASAEDLLLSTDILQFQIVVSGVINRSSGSQVISWGSLGYRPLVVLVSQNSAYIVYNNDNSATVTVLNQQATILSEWDSPNRPVISNRIEWLALRPGV